MGEDKKISQEFDSEREVTKIMLDQGIIPTGDGYVAVSDDAAKVIKNDINSGQSFSSDNSDGPDCCP